MLLLTNLFNKLWIYVLISAFVLLFIWKVYKAGGDKEKLDQLQGQFDAVVRRNEVKTKVDSLPDDAITSELRKRGWIKDST